MSQSFQHLLSCFGRDDRDGAAALIVQRFAGRLVALAARKISPGLRQRVGPEDVLQSVLATLFKDPNKLFQEDSAGVRPTQSWEHLWGYLATLASRRVCRHAQRNKADCRDMTREVALGDAVELLAREPGPSDVAAVEELYGRLLEKLRAGRSEMTGEAHCHVARMLFEGAKYDDVVRDLGTSLSTVGRVRKYLERYLVELSAEDEAWATPDAAG